MASVPCSVLVLSVLISTHLFFPIAPVVTSAILFVTQDLQYGMSFTEVSPSSRVGPGMSWGSLS